MAQASSTAADYRLALLEVLEAGTRHTDGDADGDPLDDAVTRYLLESGALARSSDVERAVATLGGDVRLIEALLVHPSAEVWPVLTADISQLSGPLQQDLAGLFGVIEGTATLSLPVTLGIDEDPVAVASEAIRDIGDEALAKLTAVAGAAVLPPARQLGEAVSAVLGATGGDLVPEAVDRLRGIVDRVRRAVVRILGLVLEKAKLLLGGPSEEQLGALAGELFAPNAILGRLLGTDELRIRAAWLADSPDVVTRVAAIRQVHGRHARDQRWVGWGAKALGYARASPVAHLPMGPALLGAAALALLLVGFWLAHDHLDAPTFAWLPDRVAGIGASLPAS